MFFVKNLNNESHNFPNIIKTSVFVNTARVFCEVGNVFINICISVRI